MFPRLRFGLVLARVENTSPTRKRGKITDPPSASAVVVGGRIGHILGVAAVTTF